MTTDKNPGCEWVLENLDAFIDHELGQSGHAAVTAHCAHCGSCTRELDMAIRVRKLLRAMPAFEAPPSVIDAAEQEIRSATSNVVALPARRNARLLRAAALVAALILVVAGAWTVQKQRAAREQARVREASAQLALAFTYVNRYSNGVVREDVMEKRVMPHIEKAMTSRDSAKPDRNVTLPAPNRS